MLHAHTCTQSFISNFSPIGYSIKKKKKSCKAQISSQLSKHSRNKTKELGVKAESAEKNLVMIQALKLRIPNVNYN